MSDPQDVNGDAQQPPDPGSAAPPPARRGLGRGQWTALATGVALAFAIWLVVAKLPAWLTTSDVSRSAAAETGTVTDASKIQATLFHVSDDGTALAGASQDILYAATTVEQVRRLVEAQVRPPARGKASAIPQGTTIRAVFVTAEHEAYVDLGGAIVTGHPGGSLNEALTVYAIVNAITVNLPDITGVQILIDGKEVDSLAGHIDLRHPLGKALDWIEKDTH